MLTLGELEEKIKGCSRCRLCKGRNSIVFGEGNEDADIMLIGEGPGRDEDIQGKPFVGKAGQLLTKILNAIDLDRGDVYIANIVKCRPPYNRVPTPDEAQACIPILRYQTAVIHPKIIVCLGSTAAKYIIHQDARITQIRGEWINRKGYWLMPTFHPAALLRDVSKKKLVWEDFKKIRDKYKEINSF
ncbi:MAG: uracil-DNA glycosylase [Clostridia bacterium]|nr:uracil-DNA glycosylase [Clostridia bacterium]